MNINRGKYQQINISSISININNCEIMDYNKNEIEFIEQIAEHCEQRFDNRIY